MKPHHCIAPESLVLAHLQFWTKSQNLFMGPGRPEAGVYLLACIFLSLSLYIYICINIHIIKLISSSPSCDCPVCAMAPSLGPAVYLVYMRQWARPAFAKKFLRRWFTRWVNFRRRGDIVHFHIMSGIASEELHRGVELPEEDSDSDVSLACSVVYDNVTDYVTDDGF